MKKSVKIIAIVLVFILLSLAVLPFVFKSKIIALVKEKANEQINAHLSFDEDISLSLLSGFPYFNLGMHQLCITGINEFEGDTLCYVKDLNLSLDVMSVIKGQSIQIRKIQLESPIIHAIVLKGGQANWDIAKTDTTAQTVDTAAPSPYAIQLKSFQVSNGFIRYEDREGGIYAELQNAHYNLSGDFTESLFELNQQIDIGKLTALMGGVKYLNQVHAVADVKMDANMNDFSFVFKDNHFSLNELAFQMNGKVQMKDDAVNMDITYAAKENTFKNFLSLIPSLYAGSFKDLESKGTLQFNGFAKGSYTDKTLPSFEFNLGVSQGWFKYPSLPAPVEKFEMALKLSNPDGELDHTKVALNKLHFEIKNEPVDIHLIVTEPISNPFIDMSVHAKLNFANVLEIMPMPGMDLKGNLTADLDVKGHVNDIENKQFDQFKASGNLTAQNVYVKTADLPAAFELKNASLSFTPQFVQMPFFDAKMGASDFQLNGSIENPILYYFKKGTLVAKLNLMSQYINANQLMGVSANQSNANSATDTTQLNAPSIPTDVNIDFIASIQQLDYTNLNIKNFNGQLILSNGKVALRKIALKTLGSSMNLTGTYDGTNLKAPLMDMDFTIHNLNFKSAFEHFNTVKQLAPIAEHMEGVCDASFKMNTPLTSHLQPVMGKVNATGNLFVQSAQISNVQVLNKLAEQFKNPALNNIGIQQVGIAFEVKDGKVFTKPFELKFANKVMKVSGSTSLDQQIDYTGTLSLSKSELGMFASGIEGSLDALNKQLGTQIKMSELIPVAVNIDGTFKSPTVTTNIKEVLANQTAGLKDQAKAELEKKKAALEAQAKAELEKQLNAAQAKADQLKNEAANKVKSEAARLKAEAEAKAKAEADKLKKKAEEEGLKRLKGLF